MVEEMDSQVALDRPATPTRIDIDGPTLLRSPGAVSQMSGSTAISSFSMVEAQFLESKFIVKHTRKLCEAADEFLDHIAPDSGSIETDLHNIQEIQKPDSDFTDEYRDFDDELQVHLKHFKGEERNYIHTRAVHHALLGPNSDEIAAQTGIDLVLYLTNVLVFAKQMIYSDRSTKDVWDALRQLDNSFPSHFMHSLVPDMQPTSAGESALVKATFDLALELRTQLAILVLQRASQQPQFDPEEAVAEVFMLQNSGVLGVRGWNVSAFGGEDSVLPQEFQDRVNERLNMIRGFFALDVESLESGELVDLEGLSANFPWEALILRLLDWARHRHRELRQTIGQIGGTMEILKKVKNEMEKPRPSIEETNDAPAPRQSPRKKRTSFGRDRRRSSRKFDPNAPVDLRTIDALKARENEPGVLFEIEAERTTQGILSTQDVESTQEVQTTQEVQSTPPPAEGNPVSQPTHDQEDEWQPMLGDDLVQPETTLIGESTLVGEPEIDDAKAIPPGPPSSAADVVKALKAPSRTEKENRRFVDRQPGAQRVDFGNGFSQDQPTPGPSNQAKGKTRADAVPSKKRGREDDDDEDDEDDEDDAYDNDGRTASSQLVKERRMKAPVAKKIRLNPPSDAPPSHQPPQPTSQIEEPEQDESTSEKEAPEMTEEAPNEVTNAPHEVMQAPDEVTNAPPSSTYQDVAQLATQNGPVRRRERQPRRQWSAAAEEAFIGYMERFPQGYAQILKTDRDEDEILQEWSQVNLKDKARNMAVNMIK
jgi:hypothetical protein